MVLFVQNSTFESPQNTAFSSVSSYPAVCRLRHIHGQHVWHKCLLPHKPTFFCSSLIKSEPEWLQVQEFKLDAKKKKSCINVHRTAIRSQQILIEQPHEACKGQ